MFGNVWDMFGYVLIGLDMFGHVWDWDMFGFVWIGLDRFG